MRRAGDPSTPGRSLRPLALCWLFVWGIPAVAACWLALADPAKTSWLLGACLLVATIAGFGAVQRLPRAENWAVALSTLSLLVLWPEIGLRLAGFEFDRAGVVQFGFPKPERIVEFERDPELFWRLRPGVHGHNSFGFLGREWKIPKPPGVFRIAFFGDSCTYQPYPALVESELKKRRPALNGEACSLGVPGYSSHQGRILVERWAKRLEPNVAFVYYGWNDHWQAYGTTDSEKSILEAQPGTRLARCLSRSALLEWLAKQSSRETGKALGVPRVSREEYRANLTAIGTSLLALGITPVFITAPTSHGRLGVPGALLERGLAVNAALVVRWHREYADIVRDVARRPGFHLLDLAARADALGDPDSVFFMDGIHFDPSGLEWIANEIVDFLERERLLPGPATGG
jgi:lysophospholipase L1-like esterase